MRKITISAIFVLLFVTAGLATAAAGDEKASKDAPKSGTSITVVGTLIKGVECQALREDKTNKIFTLTKKPKGFKNGDHVKVTGKVVDISICQQGTTIAVTKIVKVK